MFKNYLKIAWRNLKTNCLFSIINIVGLSMGLAVVLLLFLFISNERGFDQMYPKKDRIYRVLTQTNGEFRNETWATTPVVTAWALKENVANVETAARIMRHAFGESASLRANDQNFTENRLYWVDKELLSIFDIELVQGNSATALDRPNTVVLSRSAAQLYFSGQDPMGKTLLVDNNKTLEVTGVYDDFPSNSTLDANIMASSNGYWFYDQKYWSNASFETYCLLKENVSSEATEHQLAMVLNDEVAKEDQWFSLALQPLAKVHLYSASYMNSYASRIGDIEEVRNLTYLALLILLIACINYMNLTTARSQKRSKEVGVSKTLGAMFGSLVARFYVETGLITLISILVGVMLALLTLPWFNALTNQDLKMGLLFNGTFIAVVFGVWVFTTFVSGLYPSLYLSRFSPKEILSPSLKKDQASGWVRKGLVVLQFAASAALIVGVSVIYQQTRFLQEQKLGFEPENVLAISVKGIGNTDGEALMQELGDIPEVLATSMAQGFPGTSVSLRTMSKKESDERGANIRTNVTDSRILEVLKLDLLAGKNLPDHKAESDTLVEVVLNKKAVDFLGYTPEEAIGKEIYIGMPNTIVGVVADFNYASLHEPIGAYAFHNNKGEGKSFMLVRMGMRNLPATMEKLKGAFARTAPNLDFNYSFLDQNLRKLYEREKRAGQISIVFCFLAVLIASLGLFGLAAFMAEQRKKEIGIRKVLGASVSGVVKMLSKDFVKLVLLSLLIAFPVAYMFMEKWLEGFAYRIEISWWIFGLAGLAAVAIALVTVSFQAIKAAMANPVKSLRSE